jgi:hypothetical protein
MAVVTWDMPTGSKHKCELCELAITEVAHIFRCHLYVFLRKLDKCDSGFPSILVGAILNSDVPVLVMFIRRNKD